MEQTDNGNSDSDRSGADEKKNDDGSALAQAQAQNIGDDDAAQWRQTEKDDDATIGTNVATCHGITIDKISSQIWHDAKARIRRLLDGSLSQAEREQIAASLTDMCDRMRTKNILETNIPHNVQLTIQLGTTGAGAGVGVGASAADYPHSSTSVESFNERLRDRIAEFNHGLVSLADGICRLKNKLLTIEYCTPSASTAAAAAAAIATASSGRSSIDVHVCRNIHKNFRRILQKESRFLRDELFAAKETIYRLERRTSSPSHADSADNAERSTQLVPYHEYLSSSSPQPPPPPPPPPFHPAAYFDVEHAPPPQLWPHGGGAAAAAAPPFMAYPAAAVWQRMYAHPELSRHLQSYDNVAVADATIQQGLHHLPHPVCTAASNAIAIQQPAPAPAPAWMPIGRALTDDSDCRRQPEREREREQCCSQKKTR